MPKINSLDYLRGVKEIKDLEKFRDVDIDERMGGLDAKDMKG